MHLFAEKRSGIKRSGSGITSIQEENTGAEASPQFKRSCLGKLN